MLRKGCYRLSFVLAFSYVWMGENGSKNTVRMEGHFLFLKKKEKDFRFKKISRWVWMGPKIQIFFFVVLSWHECYRRLVFIYLPHVITTMKETKALLSSKNATSTIGKVWYDVNAISVFSLAERTRQHLLANRQWSHVLSKLETITELLPARDNLYFRFRWNEDITLYYVYQQFSSTL